MGAEIYLEETFQDGDKWEDRWIQSTHKGGDAGKFVLTAGKFYGDAEKDKGIQTSQDAKFYGLSTEFKPVSNKDKPLVVQFTVKHEQNIDCGGGYVKLFDCKLDQTDMHGDSPYHIMFGPDICGPGTKKVHVIFTHKEKNHLIKKDIRCKDDVFTHLYTLIVNPDGTYEVLIDNESAQKGSLTDDWDFLPPKKIEDPEDVKPEDWEKPEHIADPDATKPEDWDDEMDGEWEPPIFDNIMITDDPAEAKKAGEDLWAVTKDAEKKMKDEQDEEERKKAEADAKKDEDEDDEDLDDIIDEDEDKEELDEGHDEL